MAGGRTAVAVALVTAVALSAGGYAWADAADLVPGPLTARATTPPPLPPEQEPVVSAPPAPTTLPVQAVPPAPDQPEAVDAPVLAAVLAPLLVDPSLGPDPALSVRDLATGTELVQTRSTAAVEPASTAKLVTAAAALSELGAERRLVTRVAWVPADQRPTGRPAVVLVGGGDLLLAAGEGDPAATDGRVGLLDLARDAVLAVTEGPAEQQLLGGAGGVDVVVDDSLLGAPQQLLRQPGDAFFASTPSSLAVEAGRLGSGLGRDSSPAATAGSAFATALDQAFTEVLGAGAPAVGAPQVVVDPVGSDVVIAEGRSAPVADVLAYLLVTSDNTVADSVAGLVAAERGETTTLARASEVIVEVVEQDLGIDLGPTSLTDGSGLSDGSLSSAAALSGLLAAAAVASEGSDLSLLPSLLPVAGAEGTLSERFTGEEGSADGRGVVRAKTGTLTGTTALSGVATTSSGRGVSFALLTDQVPVGATDSARAATDRVAAAIAACC
jgi:D-alanyl-D-alanine carboxypeptidase/D-alanyl-D-alanine-endopeptidase (penicillin-binding protein 4)